MKHTDKRFGIPEADFESLIRLTRMVRKLEATPSDVDQAELVRSANALERSLKKSVPDPGTSKGHYRRIERAAAIVLQNNYPEYQETEVLDRYRNSPIRQARALPFFAAMEAPNPEEGEPVESLDWKLDYVLREAPPTGPKEIKSQDEYGLEFCARLKQMVAEMTARQETPASSFAEICESARDLQAFAVTKLGWEIPVECIAFLAGRLHNQLITPTRISELPAIFVRIPLDCSPGVACSEVEKIMYNWRKLRAERRGKRDHVRETSDKRRARLEGLVSELRAHRGTYLSMRERHDGARPVQTNEDERVQPVDNLPAPELADREPRLRELVSVLVEALAPQCPGIDEDAVGRLVREAIGRIRG